MIHRRRGQLIEVGFWDDIDDDRLYVILKPVFKKLLEKVLGDKAYAYPDVRRCIDPAWSTAERATVLAYLAKGELVPGGEYGFSTCRICGCRNGTAEFTDGVYVWPEGFVHYIREHGVKPPDEQFIRYVIMSPHRTAADAAKARR